MPLNDNIEVTHAGCIILFRCCNFLISSSRKDDRDHGCCQNLMRKYSVWNLCKEITAPEEDENDLDYLALSDSSISDSD